jgi:hypothetical protein
LAKALESSWKDSFTFLAFDPNFQCRRKERGCFLLCNCGSCKPYFPYTFIQVLNFNYESDTNLGTGDRYHSEQNRKILALLMPTSGGKRKDH